MKLRPESLDGALRKGLSPVYLIAGDEPLLRIEAADAVRAAAREQGFTEREVMFADARFDWGQLHAAGQSMSLFGDRRLLDVRVESGPDRGGQQAITEFVKEPPEDTVLLLTAGRVEASRAWVKAVEKGGALVQIWPLRANEMPGWLKRRCQQMGVNLDADAFAILQERVEGNLLAAQQELARLALLDDGTAWTRERLQNVIADNARFDAFGWVDAVLHGDAGRSVRVLDTLRAEGMEALAILGALNAALRRGLPMARELAAGGNLEGLLKKERYFGDRANSMRALLKRCVAADLAEVQGQLVEVDRAVKGGPGDPWMLLAQLGLRLCNATR